MIIKQLAEVIFRFYNDGRVSSTGITFTEADILQMAKMAYANMQRLLYYESKKDGGGDEYYFYSGILSVKRFPLSDANSKGMRRLDMTGIETYRLPKNSHLTNVYPIGCTGEEGDFVSTQVAPGEENFYAGDPELSFFKFHVVKGQGINTYNWPGCVRSADVESTFDDPAMDVPLDICFNVASQILDRTLRIPGFTGKSTDNSFETPTMIQLRSRLQQQQDQQLV